MATVDVVPRADGEGAVGDAAKQWGSVGTKQLVIGKTETPVNASATGTKGTIVWDTDFVYICTATDTWKRSALSTW